MRKWTVVRHWQGIEADRATDAIAAATLGTHNQVHTHVEGDRSALGQLLLTAEEIHTLLQPIPEALQRAQDGAQLAQSDAVRKAMQRRATVLNSLRTALTELHYSLLPPDEREALIEAEQEARDQGLIA